MWFIFSLLTVFAWGVGGFLYKLGNDYEEKYSSLKTLVNIGFFFGLYVLIYYVVIMHFDYDFRSFIIYLPISFAYIFSMWLSYVGLRYLMASIAFPISNASGGFVAVLLVIFTGERISIVAWCAVFLITFGIVLIGFLEGRAGGSGASLRGRNDRSNPVVDCFADARNDECGASLRGRNDRSTSLRGRNDRSNPVVDCFADARNDEAHARNDEAHALNDELRSAEKLNPALALLFPLGYMVFDAVGTMFDGIVLDTGYFFLGGEKIIWSLDEDSAQISYMLSFFLVGFFCFIYLFLIKKIKFSFPNEKYRAGGAILETIGQVFYVFAMSKFAVLSAPLICTFSVIPIVLGHIFLKEKLKRLGYLAIFLIIIGTIILGIYDY